MSPSDDLQPDDLQSDDQPDQQRVRGLLADLAASDERDPAPVPADVAARLDTVLADLARQPSATTTTTTTTRPTVVPLRRRLAPVLAAAAAVVLVAGGGALVLTQGADDAASDSSAAGGATSQSEGQSEAESEVAPSEESGSADAPQQDPEVSGSAAPGDPDGTDSTGGSDTRMVAAPYVSLDSLSADVTQLVADGEVAVTGAADTASARQRVEGSGCVVPAADRGAATLVMLEGDPAVLVVGQEQAGELPVEVLSCADGSVTGQAQVPAG